MPRSDARWVEVSPSQFAHEQAGLATVQRWLPNESPYRAWTNFEFRDGHGHWHECDLLVLAPGGLYLIELKHYYGTLDGDDRRWRRNGGRYEDSPLLLCRRKAQRLASKLKDAAKQWAREVGQDPENLLALVPYVQEAVFLHHETFRCLLPPPSALGLYGLEDAEDTSNLPPLSELVFQPPRSGRGIGPNADAILAKLMERIGLDADSRGQSGNSLFTLEAHINYLHEVKLGTEVWVQTQIIGFDRKRLHVYHSLHRAGFDQVLAASEQMLLHVDLAGPKSAPFGERSVELLRAIVLGQRDLPDAEFAGRVIALPG